MDLKSIAEKHSLRALGVIGSRARGDHSQHSDFDLIGLSDKAGFSRFLDSGIVVELHTVRDVSDWASRPSWWYAISELRVEIDDGTLSTLPNLIEEWRKDYSVPLEEARRNRDWLEATVRKLHGANSYLASAFVLTTNTWEILAGAFLARNVPVPAQPHMFRLAPQILGEDRFRNLIMGSEDERARTALELCDEIVQAHNKRIELA